MMRAFPETPEQWQEAVDEAHAYFEVTMVELFRIWRQGGDVGAAALDQTLRNLDLDLYHDEVLERGAKLGIVPSSQIKGRWICEN
jgi:hypothetical protein